MYIYQGVVVSPRTDRTDSGGDRQLRRRLKIHKQRLLRFGAISDHSRDTYAPRGCIAENSTARYQASSWRPTTTPHVPKWPKVHARYHLVGPHGWMYQVYDII